MREGRTKHIAKHDFPLNPSFRPNVIHISVDDPPNPCGLKSPSENSPLVSPDSILRNHMNNVWALLGSSFDPMSPSDGANTSLPGDFSRAQLRLVRV